MLCENAIKHNVGYGYDEGGPDLVTSFLVSESAEYVHGLWDLPESLSGTNHLLNFVHLLLLS